MSPIILTEDQTRVLGQGPVPVCDPQGNLVGHIEPIGFTPEEIAAAKRRAASPSPWCTGDQVRDHLTALQEAEKRAGPLDKSRVRSLLKELRSKERE